MRPGDAGESSGDLGVQRLLSAFHGAWSRWKAGTLWRPTMFQFLACVLVISVLGLLGAFPCVSDGPACSRFLFWSKTRAKAGADRVFDSGDGYVEVMHAGWYVRLPVALNLSLWTDAGIVYDDPKHLGDSYARVEMIEGLRDIPAGGLTAKGTDSAAMGAGQEASRLHLPEPDVPLTIAMAGLHIDKEFAEEQCPTGDIRVLIGIITRCCGSLAFTNREAVRKTWMQLVNSRHADYLDARFFISQPASRKQFLESYNALRGEVKLNNDVVVLPGEEDDMELPRKSLQILQYAVESPCNYTHIMKVDDECYLRADNLLRLIRKGHPNKNSGEGPWMHKMFIGRDGGNWERNHHMDIAGHHSSPRLHAPHDGMADGHRHPVKTGLLGWGFVMSRDKAEGVVQRVRDHGEDADKRTRWWSVLPWEDTLIGVMLAHAEDDGSGPRYHSGFKEAWNGCPHDTMVKHLDVDAPEFQYRLFWAEMTDSWTNVSIDCSAGNFALDDYEEWRSWRDALPDMAMARRG